MQQGVRISAGSGEFVSQAREMVVFYELQLILLVSSCLVFLLLEHHASSRKRAAAASAKDYHADRLETGGNTIPVNALASLTRQYLLVYAIVMGGLDLEV